MDREVLCRDLAAVSKLPETTGRKARGLKRTRAGLAVGRNFRRQAAEVFGVYGKTEDHRNIGEQG